MAQCSIIFAGRRRSGLRRQIIFLGPVNRCQRGRKRPYQHLIDVGNRYNLQTLFDVGWNLRQVLFIFGRDEDRFDAAP